ncbi:phospholipase A and acyltransferase 2-like [Brachionichthys hirsutus]|uniref:phospholipase A and acyltransferase 2-like n=1 Tax=Brachionichthys hirsutus TaxID=412623 RepID=UPI003604A788
MEERVSTAKFGDLIEFAYPIGYSHWAVYDEDGHVFHFAIADEGTLKTNIRNRLQTWLPLCGDLLLGQIKIRRVPIGEVNVPKGAHIMISNNRHAFQPSAPEDMRRRRDALLGEELPYHLLNLNCEHFATFVRYGKVVCNQSSMREKDVENEETTRTFNKIVDAKESA